MRPRRVVSSKQRVLISMALMAALAAAVLCLLPRVLPYERINVFYGLSQGSDRHFVESLPAGGGDQEVYLVMDNLMNIPSTALLADGRLLARVSKAQTDGKKPVTIPAGLLTQPRGLRLSLAFEYSPFIRLGTNVITIPVE